MLVCPKKHYVLVNSANPSQRIPASCNSYGCDVCGYRAVSARVRLVAWSAQLETNVRLLTLTLVPEDWQHARQQIRDYVRRVRQHYRIEMAWAIERNPKKTGYHAHAITWGEWMPNQHLQQLWGGRHTDIRRMRRNKYGYLAKAAAVCGYVVKGFREHLAVNGGRPIHMTRGYLHGLTSHQARSLWKAEGEWHMEVATNAEIKWGVTTPKRKEDTWKKFHSSVESLELQNQSASSGFGGGEIPF